MEEKKVLLAAQQAAKKERQREEARAILATLAEKWPHIFSPEATTIPLKIRVREDIIAATPEYGAKKIRRVLKHYFNIVRGEYLRALAAGGPRFDLNGNECGVITEKEQGIARAQLEGPKATLDEA